MKKFTSLISVTLAASMMLSVTGCLNKYVNPMGTAALEKYAKDYGAECYRSGHKFAVFYKDTYGDVGKLSDGIYIRAEGKDAQQAIECSNEIPVFYDEDIEQATVFAAGDMGYYRFNECFCVSMVFGSDRDAGSYYDLAVDSYYVHSDSNVIEASDFDPRMVFDIYTNDRQVEQARRELISELTKMGATGEIIDEWLQVFDKMYDIDYDLVLESFEDDDGLRYTLLTGSHGDVFYTAGIYVKKSTVFYAYGFGYDEEDVNAYLDDICGYMKLTPPSSL